MHALTMRFRETLHQEIKVKVLTMLYFGGWIGGLLVVKKPFLAEYGSLQTHSVGYKSRKRAAKVHLTP